MRQLLALLLTISLASPIWSAPQFAGPKKNLYESVRGSGDFDSTIDMTPVRTINAQFDGWRITGAAWHYALGQPTGESDGWVGFGARQGQHWFLSRLQNVGYIHWPTRTLDDIGGAPDYDRANLTNTTDTENSVNFRSVATWSNIWTTPGGGSIDIEWVATQSSLKERIILNQAGRDWITANRPPTTPLDETYFAFVFKLDWSDIPKVARDKIQINLDDDWEAQINTIELLNDADELLSFLPIDDVRVEVPRGTGTSSTEYLQKRFYKIGDEHFMIVGVRADKLNAMTDGDLVFDPTVSFDASSTRSGTTSSPATWSHTTSGSDRLLVLAVNNWAGRENLSATYNSVSMTEACTAADSNNDNITLFYLVNPASGANTASISVGSGRDIAAAANSYTSVDQATPVGTCNTATGNSTGPSVTVTSSGDTQLIVDGLTFYITGGCSVGAGQTARATYVGFNSWDDVCTSEEDGASPNVVMSYTTGNVSWAIAGIPLNGAAAAEGGVFNPRRILVVE